ncbi:MAG TPA: hypothetical protein VJH03_23080 [Blastocatellia bacterium]|nr:hypothetical protein [Blastocatellia bacterium]
MSTLIALAPMEALTCSRQEETLTNETIVTMTKAGFSPGVIVGKIRSSKTNFNMSMSEMLKLKQENVADAVIEAMIGASQPGAGAPAPVNAAPKADPNDPASPHEPGVYLLKETTDRREMIQIEPSVYSQSKSGGFFKSAVTYGIAKVKSKAVLAGNQAKIQVNHRRPVFYFYFEVTQSGLSSSGNVWQGASTTPNEFVLVKTEVKKNSRELVVGEFNAFGAQSGTLDKYVQPFDYDKISPGVYRVTPRSDLADGEYCFYYGGSAAIPTYGFGSVGSPKVFDFGVQQPRLN